MRKIRRSIFLSLAVTAGVAACAGATYSLLPTFAETANSSATGTFEMAGASIRFTRDKENGTKGDGICFGVILDKTTYESYISQNYELGILAMPKRLLSSNSELTISTSKVGTMVTYSADEESAVNQWKNYEINGEEQENLLVSSGYIWNIPSAYYNDDFIVRGYAKSPSGSVVYTEAIERSVDYVALAAKKDLNAKLESASEEEKTNINEKITQLNEYLAANEYTVTYKDSEGNVLGTQTGVYGDELNFDGTIPEKESREVYSYVFKEWRASASENAEKVSVITESKDVYPGYSSQFRSDKMLISYMTEARPSSDGAFDVLEDSGINCHFSWRYEKADEAYCEARGLAFMPFMNNKTPETLLSEKNVASFGDSVVGFYYQDEPNYDDLAALGSLAENHAQNWSEKTFYVNLHPCWFDAENQADNIYDGHTYDEYVKKYCEVVFGYINQNRFLSVDVYPLLKSGKLSESWLYTYEVLSKYAKQYNAKLHFYVSTMEHGDYRKTDLNNLRYTINVAMTYGAKALSYFTYAQYESETDLKGLVSGDGLTKNEEYYYAQTVNKELLHWDSIYQGYTWNSVMTVRGSSDSSTNANYSHLKATVSSVDGVNSISATRDTLVGSFSGNNGEKAVMITNFSDPYNNFSDTVEVTFNNAAKVAVFKNGNYSIVNLSDNKLTLTLSAGEAAFVIISGADNFNYRNIIIEGDTYTYEQGDVVKIEPNQSDRHFIAWYLNDEFYSYNSKIRYTVGDENAEFTAIYGDEYITATSGTLSYDSEFTFGDEEYSSKLTGNGWTIDIKLCGEQMDETAYDYVVFQIYTTDFKCNCTDQGHAGTQALRDLPTTSYSSGYVSLGNAVWTEVVLKVADYNALISNQSRLRIHNNCTAHGKEVWISQPKGVKSESWFTGGTQAVSVANSYNGKPTTSVKNSGWSVDLTVTTATEHTTGNMVFYIKTNNYTGKYGNAHAVRIKDDNTWYSSAIVVGEWMKVTIPVSVWNDKCVTGGKQIRINDGQNNANVVYYISEVTWEATPIKVTIEGETQQYLPGSIIKVSPSETERLFVAWYLNGSFYSYDKELNYTVGEEEAEFTAIYGGTYITATSGTLSYDSEFTFGDEEYSSKLTGNGWTIDIKLCGEQMDEAAYDYVVFQIYTTDFKCTCTNQGHAGTQALRDLPTTSYSSGYVSLGNAVWTEVVLKVADYNALISNQSRLRIHNNCTAHGKEVWISQPKGVKSESWFTGGTQSVSVANSYNGKPTTSVKNSGWSVDLTVTTATEHTTGNMVFYIKTNNYAKGHDSDHAVKINNKWYSSAIVVGEWMKVTIPVSVWNDECVAGGKQIKINDSNNNANVVYYISEVVWEA